MLRRFGLLGLAFVFAATCGLIAPNSVPVVMADDAPSFALADTGDDSGGDDNTPKKRMKKREYAKVLQRKLKKGGPPPEKPKYKPWGKVITKDHQKHDGLITVYTKQEELYFVLGEDDFDKPMLSTMSLSQGIGSNFVFGGLPVDNMMFDFHREKDHVQIRRLSTNFRGGEKNEGLKNALALTFSESIVASVAIASEKNGEVAIKMDKVFLSDVAGMSLWLGAVFRQPVRLSRDSNYFKSIHNYPENTEIDTRLTYSPGNPQTLNLPNVPDSRFIQVGVHYSIHRLPEKPWMPRIADDRVGYFTTSHKDFTREKEESFFVHYANRWRLEKKDPSAALSEPVKPIIFYLDNTIPDEYIEAVKEGVESWQAAFEKAGFKNAIIAKRAPTPEEDPEYAPEDARYNTIRWNVSDQVMYGAIGPSQVDPRTGEIIDADIIFEHSIVTGRYNRFRQLGAPRSVFMAEDPLLKELWMTDEERAQEISINDIPQLRGKQHMFCELMNFQSQDNFLVGMARGFLDPDAPLSKEFIHQMLRMVAAHEVGHTLGLRHNFKSSGSTPYNKLNDKKTIEEIGMTGSVMDYATPNLAFNSSDQGYYYGPTVGSYDKWAIEWGYKDVDGDDEWTENKNLQGLAAMATEKANLYGTDEDTYPMAAMDPRSNIRDLSDNPLAWAKERMMIVDDLMGEKLIDRVVEDGGSYVSLRYAVATLMLQRYTATRMLVKNIGGAYTSRDHRGSSQMPIEPVPVSAQRDALKFVIDEGFNSAAFLLPTSMVNRMMDDKMWSWENNLFSSTRRFDYPLSSWASAYQVAMLYNLLNPGIQTRIVEASVSQSQALKLSELYGGLTKKIWTSNTTPSGRTAAVDRNVQRAYTQILINNVMMPNPAMPFDGVALSRLHLQRIKRAAQAGLSKSGLDDETNAHLTETIARIDRVLDANRISPY